MKTKFTPGPWWVDDDEMVAAGSGDSYVTIADPHCSKIDPDDRTANANLISAAPEMFDAIMMVFDTSLDGGNMGDIDWQQLRDVIHKAKGETK